MKAFFERLYDKSDNQFYREMKRNLQEETKMFIIIILMGKTILLIGKGVEQKKKE